jgi:hypothetical protein
MLWYKVPSVAFIEAGGWKNSVRSNMSKIKNKGILIPLRETDAYEF